MGGRFSIPKRVDSPSRHGPEERRTSRCLTDSANEGERVSASRATRERGDEDANYHPPVNVLMCNPQQGTHMKLFKPLALPAPPWGTAAGIHGHGPRHGPAGPPLDSIPLLWSRRRQHRPSRGGAGEGRWQASRRRQVLETFDTNCQTRQVGCHLIAPGYRLPRAPSLF